MYTLCPTTNEGSTILGGLQNTGFKIASCAVLLKSTGLCRFHDNVGTRPPKHKLVSQAHEFYDGIQPNADRRYPIPWAKPCKMGAITLQQWYVSCGTFQ